MRRAVALVLVLALLGGGAWFLLVKDRGGPGEEVREGTESLDELGTRSITLFYGNRQGDGLVSETRTIQARRHRDEEVEAVVDELLRGPHAQGAVRTVPADTRLRDVFYDEEQRLLYLDFNQALVAQMGGSTMEILTLASIVRTIAIDFPEVEAVQILIDGLEVETLGGHIDLTRPLRTGDWL